MEPISWEFRVDSSELKSSRTLNLIFTPTTEIGWYIYSSDNDPDSGPRTEFEFFPNKTYDIEGGVIPENVKTKYDEVWEADVRYLDNKGSFRQKIILSNETPSISGYISYQVCSEIEKMCIPLEKDFTFFNSDIRGNIPYDQEMLIFEEEKSLLSFMLFAFFAGFLAILTPCVFPMIPLTVSYFANKKNSKKSYFEAIVFGLSIMFIFTFLGVFLSLIMGPQSANELATSWIPNLIFFLLFVVFGLSLIGFFELTIPSNIITSFDKKSQEGGLWVFFMAFTLVLVSFSCTGPLVGSILVQSASGLQIKPILGMLSFLCFLITVYFACNFSSKLQSLPKSGNWMVTLRVILGFIAIAFSLKFLSVVDKAYHFNLLDRELFLLIWIGLFFILSLYLLG